MKPISVRTQPASAKPGRTASIAANPAKMRPARPRFRATAAILVVRSPSSRAVDATLRLILGSKQVGFQTIPTTRIASGPKAAALTPMNADEALFP
jgi:hypothetical protein